MNKIVVLLFIVFLYTTSCVFFNEDPKPIDFTSIDEYPLYDGCDSLAKPEVKRKCFEEKLLNHIQKDLDTCQYIPEGYLRNTGIIIHIDVLRDGSFSVHEIEKLSSVEAVLPELKYQIVQSIKTLPKAKPGKKKNQYVQSRFMIPLYIENN